MSTLKLISKDNTRAEYTTNAVLGKTNRLRMHDALARAHGARYIGYSVGPRIENLHRVVALLTPEAV